MKQVFNPYLPLYECIPDGEPHVFGDRVYIYGSHESEGSDRFCNLDYVTYSAPVDDLKSWRYEGVIYRAKQDPLYDKYPYMFAPDVVRGNDGKYYLYYSLSNIFPDCSYAISVAVCDTPSGKFEFLGYVKNPDGSVLHDFMVFDPGLINDNGTIRLYYGQWWDFFEDEKLNYEEAVNRTMLLLRKTREEVVNCEGGAIGSMGAVCVELCDDMMTVKTKPKHILKLPYKTSDFAGHEFFEASSMRKIGERYYFIYSTRRGHELAYATSDYPDRDFKYGGVIISNGDIGFNERKEDDRVNRTGNNHGSIENINGEWYIFYHRQTHKNEFSRQACAEKIKIGQDGSIKQVEMTSCGLNAGPLKAMGTYPSVICCNLSNGHMPHCDATNERLPNITNKGDERYIETVEDGTFFAFKYFDFENVSKIGISYRSGDIAPEGEMLIKTSFGDTVCGKIKITHKKEWTSAYTEIRIENGVYPLVFEYHGQGSLDVKDIYFL